MSSARLFTSQMSVQLHSLMGDGVRNMLDFCQHIHEKKVKYSSRSWNENT